LRSWLTAVVLLAGFPSAAGAHAYLERSAPLQGAELKESPTEIRLQFTEEIDAKLSQITLEDDKGNPIGGQLSGGDARSLIYKIPKLQSGVYKVKWQVLSVDTHVTEGSFRFSVAVPLEKEKPSETISLDGEGTSPGTAVPDTPPPEPGTKPAPNPGLKPALEPPASSPADPPAESEAHAAAPGGEKRAGAAAAFGQQSAEPGGSTEAAVAAGAESDREQTPPPDHGTAPAQPPLADAVEQVSPAAPDNGATAETLSVHPDQPAAASAGETQHHAHHGSGQHGDDWRTTAAHLLRIIDLLACVCIAGFLFFRYGIWRRFDGGNIPALFSQQGERRLLAIAVIVFAATGALRVWILADQLSGGGTNTAWHLSRTIIASTVTGSASWLRPALTVLMFALTFVPKRGERWAAVVKTLAALALIVLFPLTGHAHAASSAVSFAVFSHTLHMLAAAIWFGGLTGILAATWNREVSGRNGAGINAIIRRFSTIALPVVLALGVSGIALALLRLHTWGALLQSDYGRLVLAKTVILLFVIVIGAFHRLVLIPRMAAAANGNAGPDKKTSDPFVLAIRVEAVLALLAFVLAGMLSTTAPPEIDVGVSAFIPAGHG
jgi:putative copper export protein/methionine-rich copper-binding protein CopC